MAADTAARPITVVYAAWAPFFSGAERALLVLVENLDRSRYRPVVVLGTDGELAAEMRVRQVPTFIHPIVYRERRNLHGWAAAVLRLARCIRREKAALLHSNDVPTFQPVGYAARLLGLPAVTHVRFPDSESGFAWFLRPGFRRALFVSDALRRDAIHAAPSLFESASQVMYDGVHVPPLAGDDARIALRRELGLPLDRTLVVMAGQVAEIKGIWDYIEAAKRLAGRGLPVSFVVLGDDLKGKGATRIEAERRVEELGLADRFHFLGFRPNAQRLIPAFDMVAVPSHVEPLGNATLEAMASARPTIGSRVGGIPEMIVHEETGLLVSAHAPDELADAIESLSVNPQRARQFGLAGWRRATEKFSVAAHIAGVQSVYDTLLSNA